jgi:hypothetical protein
LASDANLSTIDETEFNQAAFRFTTLAGAGRGEVCVRRAHFQPVDHSMRIATYNVNGINGRLANLLGWLGEDRAGHCLPAGTEGARASAVC